LKNKLGSGKLSSLLVNLSILARDSEVKDVGYNGYRCGYIK